MNNLEIRKIDILKNIEYDLIVGSVDDFKISLLSYDSRKIIKNSAFVCIEGVNFDTHNILNEIIEKGSSLIVVKKDVENEIIDLAKEKNVTIVKVDNTRRALAIMSKNYFRNPSEKLKIIGITGTKGKTTTAYMIREILKDAGKKVGIIGTIGIEYDDRFIKTNNTTPESFLLESVFYDMVNSNIEYVVMEVSSQSLKYDRVYGIEFLYGIFTNISHDHIGPNEHEDFDDYLNSKLKIFKNSKIAVLNMDDMYYDIEEEYCKKLNLKILRFSNKNIKRKLIDDDNFLGTKFSCDKFNIDVDIPMPGVHNIQNAVIAITVAKDIGIDDEIIKNALSKVKVPGRVEILKKTNDITILVDYAHNEVGTYALINSIREYNPKRVVVVFGSGGNRDVKRRYGMGEAVGELADFAIVTADNSRFEKTIDIINQILVTLTKKLDKYIVIEDRREAIRYAIKNYIPGDFICVIGKGHEDYNDFMGKKTHFSDKEEILKILNE